MFDNIDLDSVRNIIDFAGHSGSFGADSTVPELQCQGVTALCNIMHNKQFAYLADEVGMGKTYQALGVISMLLRENQDAKILIIAPNESVQNNWQKEIIRFYKNNVNIKVPELLDVNKCDSIEFIRDYLPKDMNVSTLTLTRISSFSAVGAKLAQLGGHSDVDSSAIRVNSIADGLSFLTNNTLKCQQKIVDSFNASILCGRFLRHYSPEFDLVIIDEAQNMRNENNATAFLNAWLGLRRTIKVRGKSENEIEAIDKEIENSTPSYSLSSPDKQKFLLMSATPAHRSVESLRSQLSYFLEDIPETLTHEYLEKYLIRRLRTYCGESKYDVRENNTDDVEDLMGVEDRMLLALVQSRLAQEGRKNNSTFKIGFLETFESYNPSNLQEADEDEAFNKAKKEFENGGSENKFEKGSAVDKAMIDEISKSYKQSFPNEDEDGLPHPKLEYMKRKVEESLHGKTDIIPEKFLVFVRRLASVRELVNNRITKVYEHTILEYWKEKLDLKDSNLVTIQKRFEDMYGYQIKKDTEQESAEDLDLDVTDEDYDDNDENKGDNQLVSPFRSWIALKKNKDNKNNMYSSVSRFKKTMLNNKHNAYLFEENYLRTYSTVRHIHDSDYDSFVVSLVTTDLVEEVNRYIAKEEARYIYAKNGKKKSSDFRVLCCFIAMKECDSQLADCLGSFYNIKTPDDLHVHTRQYASATEVKNALSSARIFSFWNYFPEEWRTEYPWLDLMFNEKSFAKREVVKRWIEKYLKSSEAILELLYCYCNRGKKPFSEMVCNTVLGTNNPHRRRIELLLTSGNTDLVYRQLIGDEKIDYRYNPTFMNDQSWVVGAVGGNKGNEALIKRFNTPFYPDVIVCTDVLKEGINLHLFCNKVYHYGLAWTPGDLEQRVGRVDRFFSKTYRARDLGDLNAKISVNYPYMGKSIDEQQLKKVLEFKMAADPLLDSSYSTTKSIDVYALEDTPVQKLAEYIPPKNEQTVCPYPGEQFWNIKVETNKTMNT